MAPRLICHSRPERSFSFRGKKLPICSRCTGFYLFLLLGLAFALLFVPATSVSYVILLFVTVVAVAPLAVDGISQLLGWQESDNYTRFLTGSLAGALIGMDIALLLLDAIY